METSSPAMPAGDISVRRLFFSADYIAGKRENLYFRNKPFKGKT